MKLRQFAVLWFAGIPGILFVTWQVLPALVSKRPLSVPMWVVQVASAGQSMVLLGFAVLCGVILAPRVGLRAPAVEALLAGSSPLRVLRPQLAPGLVGGLAGGLMLVLIGHAEPQSLVAASHGIELAAASRLFYGGVTEELLVRWGLMTLLLWAFARPPRARVVEVASLPVLAAIISSALLFGALHLPATFAAAGVLTPAIALYVVLANASFGLVAGTLFWRHGLESAVLAHVVAHVVLLTAA